MAQWVIFALLSAVSAALVAIFGKIGVAKVDTTLATTVRAIIMAAFLFLISLSMGKFESIHNFGGSTILFIILSGLAGAASWLFYFNALKNGPAPGVASIDRLSVVFVLLFAIVFLGDKLTWKSGLGAVLITLGAILMSLK